MEPEEKVLMFFDAELQSIKDKGIQAFTRHALESAPDYFWVVPSSSTGKYHPPQSNGVGGLVRHCKAVVVFSRRFCRAYAMTGRECDVITAACLLHDLLKYGKGGMQKHTTKTHDKDTADYIHQLGLVYIASNTQPELEKESLLDICKGIAWHTGRWTTGDRAKPFPSEYTKMEEIVHLSDMMASEPDISLNSLCTPGIG